jgi:hypothetical protein
LCPFEFGNLEIKAFAEVITEACQLYQKIESFGHQSSSGSTKTLYRQRNLKGDERSGGSYSTPP